MKKSKKILAVLLTVLTVIGIFSCATTVWAEEYNEYVETKAYEEKLLTETVDSESEKAEIVCEVEEKREEYSKTYKRADGSYTTVFSQTPIHTLKDGEWKEIDNTLKTDEGILKNTDGSFDIEFPKTISENEKITVTEITTPNGKFRIIYDDWGQVLSVNVVVIKNNRETNIPLVQYTYGAEAKRTQIASVTYTNSSKNKSVYRYYYTDDGNVENITLNQKAKHTITYENLGALTQIKNDDGRTVKYTDNGVNIYNAQDVLVYTSITGGDGLTTEENYGIKYKEHESKYEYDSATGSSTNTTALDIAKYYRVEQAATTDWFGREDSHLTTIYDITEEVPEQKDATGDVIDKGIPPEVIGKISTEYEYPVADDGKTSSNVEKYINKTYNGSSGNIRVYDGYYYEYDKQNKISAEKTLNADGTTTDKYSYEYDEFGQLVRFNDAVENKTYTYTYDNNGNILTKSEYAYTTGLLGTATDTTTYTYFEDWKDKLWKIGNQEIEYDNIGNPTNYLGAILEWEGRNLKSYETEEQKFEYQYDENGMRYRTTITNKEDNSVGYLNYVWVDSKLISISFTSDELNQTVKYLYNDFDEPVGFVSTREDGSVDTYYYLKNAQGDITNIVSAAGKKMVSFTYDVFGKRTVEYQANDSTTPSHIELLTQIKADLLNPFAYRGYCYDYDMGMYYLQSRYYDPNTGRFINADDTNYLNATGTVLGCNLFAYCENDPVNNVDPTGFYSANAAIKYAKKWWNDYNIQYYHYYSGGDCTNFVSQCLFAGGYKMDSVWYSKSSSKKVKGWDMQVRAQIIKTGPFNNVDTAVTVSRWYKVSNAWRSASGLYYYLKYTKDFNCYDFYTPKKLKSYLKKGKIKKGSVAFFEDKNYNIHHSVIIGRVTKSDAFYYAHSTNRNCNKGLVSVLDGDTEQCIYVFNMG